MKIQLFISLTTLFIVSIIISNKTIAGNSRNIDLNSVTIITEYKNFYQSGDYYFGGQPTLEQLQWLKSEGVTMVINLRTDSEMNRFEEHAFNEEKLVKEMGMQYFIIPVDTKKDFTPEKLKEFAGLLENNPGKVFIHCTGCYRVTFFIMAYLIEYKNYPLNDVMSFGKKLKYTMPLEGLLDKKITMIME